MAYTKIPKPTGLSYTNINPIGKEQYDQATLTYDSSITYYDGINQFAWTNVPKGKLSTTTLVQSKTGYTGSTPLTITFNSPVTAGNLLIVCASDNLDSDTITISDNQNNTWTKAVSHIATNWNAPVTTAVIYYAVANGNNTPAVTITGPDIGGSIYEYSGVNPIVVASNFM